MSRILNHNELYNAAQQWEELQQARAHLVKARYKLVLINKYILSGKTWKVTLQLEKANPYCVPIAVVHEVHVDHVQQQAVNEVNRLRRKVIALGGSGV